MSKKSTYQPNWYEKVAPEGSYRSLFKWGNPAEFKHPNHRLTDLMGQTFEMSNEDFNTSENLGLEMVEIDAPIHLSQEQVKQLSSLVGEGNFSLEPYQRIKASYGKGMLDALRLRNKIIENIPDMVLSPRNSQDVEKIVAYCYAQKIPIYVFGGSSSVTRGAEAVKGGISLNMGVHMKRVLSFDEKDQTITVEAGMSGPALEEVLNHAPDTLQATRRYTCGHFPQSFEYSSVGGWIVTRGAGQNSTYYGKIEDIVISQEYITPTGRFKTQIYPRCSTGPDFDQIMMGSEGSFGILVNATLRICRYQPETTRYFSYMFHNWEEALEVYREVMQAEFGFPSVFRLSDPEETDVALKLYGVEGSPADPILKALGFLPMQRCLLLGSVDGEKSYTALVNRKIRALCAKKRTFDLSPFNVTKRWEKDRFRDPYLREDLHDHNIVLDTLECAVTWSQLENVHQQVREIVKKRPKTICMTHCSHAYPQGTNLYFIFIARMQNISEYVDLQYQILEAIQHSGAAMSHHHGIGKQTSPWLEAQIGTPAMDVLRALKKHFDPQNLLNPGGTLGLDMNDVQKEKAWGKDL